MVVLEILTGPIFGSLEKFIKNSLVVLEILSGHIFPSSFGKSS
jgi:hypothetical protein